MFWVKCSLSQSQCQKQDCAPVHIYTHLFDCTDLWAKISLVQFNKHFTSPCAPLNSVGIENHFTREPANKQIPPPPLSRSLFCFANEFLSLWRPESSVGALWPPNPWNLTAWRQNVCFYCLFFFSTHVSFFRFSREEMNDACSRWESHVRLMLAELTEPFFSQPPLLNLSLSW